MIRFFKVLLVFFVLTASQAFTKNKKNRGNRRNDNVQAQPVKKIDPVLEVRPVIPVEAAPQGIPVPETEPVVFSEPAVEEKPSIVETMQEREVEVQGEIAKESEAAADDQSSMEMDQVVQREPTMEAEASSEPEVVVEPEIALVVEPVVEIEAAVQKEVAVEPEIALVIEPVVVEVEAAVQKEVAVEPELALVIEPVVEVEATSESEYVAFIEPIAEVEQIPQPEIEMEADLVVKTEPAHEIKLSLGMQDTGEKPASFEYFAEPIDSLRIAARYLPDNPVIVEAGAFDGKESCIMAYLWPNGEIHAFEPVSQLYDRVLERTNPIFNISVYKRALGDRCGEQLMYLSNERGTPGIVSMSSSLYPPKEHLLYCPIVFEGAEMVKTTTLDRWAEENGVPQVDMLWLDMQGYELPALKAAPNILAGVSVILTELEFVEAYEGQPLYQEVRTWLEEQGFVLVAGNFWFPKNPDQWFGDGLFVRKELLN